MMNFRDVVARQKREIAKQYVALEKIYPAAFRDGRPLVAMLTIKPPPTKEQP